MQKGLVCVSEMEEGGCGFICVGYEEMQVMEGGMLATPERKKKMGEWKGRYDLTMYLRRGRNRIAEMVVCVNREK